ncbi:phage terminase small subunit [Nocardioides bruguierae]|uniref:Uncharacterized protein n=1 Tax=Nocardioides bruguierae TaxID=2945102 RepID=A0A9X2DC18_9ACTN|nr:hypothetical protein [Nocardioides bruguierae]MCM0622849.1 hypothetical protein [Nocardioides bruguierae]
MPARRDPRKPHSRATRGTVGAKSALVDLPAEGCDLPVPTLPKGRPEGKPWTAAQRARWRELWQSPQATQWDESAKATVATLVIFESMIYAGEASAWVAQEARYAADALGLTPKAMVSLGWRIRDEREEQQQ